MNNFKASGNSQFKNGSFVKNGFSGKKSFGGSNRSFGDKKSFGNGSRSSERPLMYPAVCSQCGRNCEVPFRPTGEKPVYCSNCFAKKTELSLDKPNYVSHHEAKTGSRTESKPNYQSNNSLEDKLEVKFLEIEAKLEAIVFKLDEALMSVKATNAKEFRTAKTVSSYKAARPVKVLAPSRTPRAMKSIKPIKIVKNNLSSKK